MASKNLRSSDADTMVTHVTMDIHRIQSYERNPRQCLNPEYDRIKDSIRQSGLDQPLVITQRPDATDYVVHSGGNTRLVILKELFEETGDARYGDVPCFVKSWRRESDVVLAHLRENDLRGNLTFIDKACAIEDARQLLAKELGLKVVSTRRLASELTKAGYRLHGPSLALITYAVETLQALIPQALRGGLGRNPIKRIHALQTAGRTVWRSHCPGGQGSFDDTFAALCRRYDAPEWDNEVLQGALETEIADASNTNIQTIRAAFDAALNDRELMIPEFVAIKAPPPVAQRDSTELDMLDDPIASDEEHGGSEPLHEDDDGGSPTTDRSIGAAPRDEPLALASTAPLIDAARSTPSDLGSLRRNAWTLASRLAARNGIGDLVSPLTEQGLGYFLHDVPSPELADQLDDDALVQINTLWWQLAACAEMTVAPLASILPVLPQDSILRQALADDDADLLFKHIWTLDPGHMGYRLWRFMSDDDWQDLIHLMENYRRIRHVSTQTSVTLWH